MMTVDGRLIVVAPMVDRGATTREPGVVVTLGPFL